MTLFRHGALPLMSYSIALLVSISKDKEDILNTSSLDEAYEIGKYCKKVKKV